MDMMSAIQKHESNNSGSDTVVTENGAIGFRTTSDPLVDFFYKVSSMRSWDPLDKFKAWYSVFEQDPRLALRLLFFVRDIRGGLGERQLFKDILCRMNCRLVAKLLPLIPVYGRWDDMLVLLSFKGTDLDSEIVSLISRQWNEDIANCESGKHVSLLAKWMPSIRKVNKDKVKQAKYLAKAMGLDERAYRKGLSALRSHLKVVERSMTLNEWGRIDYSAVPSKANLKYSDAFMAHDEERRFEFLAGVASGVNKVHAGAVYPYEIVAKYNSSPDEDDALLEGMWKALPLPNGGVLEKAIVVRDGSGSMTTAVSKGTTCQDVATSLAILMSENLKGPFANKFITFSRHPRLVDLSSCSSLREKILLAYKECEVANTDIRSTMRLILDSAVENEIPQEDIPSVVIVSDMEFDSARGLHIIGEDALDEDVLFRTIRDDWACKGYKLPRLVFWNVKSRTEAIPMQENENGLLLVSGFSQNIFDVLSDGGTMADAIKRKLMTERYDPVLEVL